QCFRFRRGYTPTPFRYDPKYLSSRLTRPQSRLTFASMASSSQRQEKEPRVARTAWEIPCNPRPSHYCRRQNFPSEGLARHKGGSRQESLLEGQNEPFAKLRFGRDQQKLPSRYGTDLACSGSAARTPARHVRMGHSRKSSVASPLKKIPCRR